MTNCNIINIYKYTVTKCVAVLLLSSF